jgi:hypothetical protein
MIEDIVHFTATPDRLSLGTLHHSEYRRKQGICHATREGFPLSPYHYHFCGMSLLGHIHPPLYIITSSYIEDVESRKGRKAIDN